MPFNAEIYPYVVIGDGMIATEKLAKRFRRFRKIKYPVPVHQYAMTLEQAQDIAKKMLPYNETLLICKVEEVVK